MIDILKHIYISFATTELPVNQEVDLLIYYSPTSTTANNECEGAGDLRQYYNDFSEQNFETVLNQ